MVVWNALVDMPRSGLPRVSHAAAAARALCDPHSHHLPTTCLVCGNSDSRCSAAQRGSTAPGRHGHQTFDAHDGPVLKDLSNTRVLKHLAPLATDYWAASIVSSNLD